MVCPGWQDHDEANLRVWHLTRSNCDRPPRPDGPRHHHRNLLRDRNMILGGIMGFIGVVYVVGNVIEMLME